MQTKLIRKYRIDKIIFTMDNREEVKKTQKANLETHRSTFILMGLVLGVAVMFFAFEWSSETTKLDEAVIVQDVLAEEEIEITRQEEVQPPPPPPPEPETPEIIEVVEEEVETRFEIQTEDDQTQRQAQTYVPPPPPQPKEEEIAEEEIFVVVEEQPQ